MITPISSTSNEWPQIQLDDHKTSTTHVMPSSSSSSPMEKTTTNQAADPHPLKCPRCDSSNTKFCYYNNYSLSQPRHFCKACKRYWTRGGTLRNVPVGGGCRKNKKLRRSGGGGGGSAATANPSSTALVQARADLSPPPNHMNTSSLFYSPLELNFPFSSYNSTRVSSSDHDAGRFDHLQPQMNNGTLGLGFSSDVLNSDYKNGFRQIQDGFPGNNNNNNNNSNSIFFGSSTFASTSTTMASLLASSLQHQKFGINSTAAASKNIQAYDQDTQMLGGDNGGENGSGWNPNPNPNEQISDPSSLLWNTTNLGAWFDPSSNMGSSSVPSLI